MRKLFTPLILCAVFIWVDGLKAQTYHLTVSTEPFVYLVDAQTAVNGPWDIPEFQIPIGFDFELFDFTSNQLYSFFNSFGGVFELNLDEDHLYMLIPFYSNLIDRGYQQDSALSPIQYKTTGLPGEKIFTLEFKEAGLYNGFETNDGVFLDYVSFQIQLYQESGDIVFRYGPYSTQEDPSVIFDPFSGPLVGLLSNADWNTPGGHIDEILMLEGNPLNPEVIYDTINIPPAFLDAPIPENVVYRFSRMVASMAEPADNAGQTMLFPNPTYGYLSLSESDVKDIIFPVNVIDAFGKRVALWNDKSEISALGLFPGCYYVVINTGNKLVTQKLVVLSQ